MSWIEYAACQGHDPETFFAEDRANLEAAKAICRRCPVRVNCLLEARARRERFGIWGGEDFNTSGASRRRRKRSA